VSRTAFVPQVILQHVPTNIEVVRAWMRALNEDDTEVALALCDPEFEMTESQTLPGAATVSGLRR
jgi:limonene-1,2-epoxide hydrolase